MLVETAVVEAEVAIVLPGADARDDGQARKASLASQLFGAANEIPTQTQVLGFELVFLAETSGCTVDVHFSDHGASTDLVDERLARGQSKPQEPGNTAIVVDVLKKHFFPDGALVANFVQPQLLGLDPLAADLATPNVSARKSSRRQLGLGNTSEVRSLVAVQDVVARDVPDHTTHAAITRYSPEAFD